MYQYTWDPETGGILLTSEISKYSAEPRPVYYKELDILGFDQYWQYPKDDSAPIMWAQLGNYFYRGRAIAKTVGGSLYTAPKLVVLDDSDMGAPLEFVDIPKMVEKNRLLMETLVQETIQRVYNTYLTYKDKVDVFYVAYSGGKDSEVALDIVQRALPHNAFLVLFGDTQMEFSDTYDIVEKTKERCGQLKIKFMTSKSEQSPLDTWREFGPPSQTIRWCCSVHKTSPQILLLRELTNNPSFRGMAFTGVRGDESSARSQYDEVSLGEKHKGQYSYHTILEWGSAEVFLYIFSNDLPLNETYKKGNSRAGCLMCPLAAQKNFYLKEVSYATSDVSEAFTTTRYNNLILETTSKVFSTPAHKKEFMDMCGWKARKSGKELNFSEDYCTEEQEGTTLKITLKRERTPWKEWIKTLGDIVEADENQMQIRYRGKIYNIGIRQDEKNQQFVIDVGANTKESINFLSACKVVFRKSAYCIGCHVCEANCPNGFIHMHNGEVSIDDKCVKCQKCHEVFHGCLVANSLRLPKGVNKMGGIDRYSNLGIEYSWVVDYFDKKDAFWDDNDLGTNKLKNLRAFLEDTGITEKKKFSEFGELIDRLGIGSQAAWGLIACNWVYSAEFNWWVISTIIGELYSQSKIVDMLGDEVSDNCRSHIASAFKNIFISNKVLGEEMGLGNCDYELKGGKRILNSIARTPWSTPIPEVILYSLYQFAEHCGEYYQFTLSTLMDDTIERDGVSPTRIFGLDEDTMKRILNGLAVNYPDFISVSFTLDLDNITLRPEKSSMDVLKLF